MAKLWARPVHGMLILAKGGGEGGGGGGGQGHVTVSLDQCSMH